MKIQKVLVVGISQTALEKIYWERIKSLTQEIVFLSKDSADLAAELVSTEVLLVNFGIEVRKEHIDMSPNLKYIGIMATAFGKVDVTYAEAKGIVVTNLPGYSTESVAEFTIAAILEQLRQLEEGKIRGRNGNYSEAGIKAREIRGKIFGVVGLGHIGARVAEIAQGFGATVNYWSKNRKVSHETNGLQYEEVDQLIQKSDFLSLNLAQTTETERFLNAVRIESLKPGVIVVNTAPMELIDIEALSGRLAKQDIVFILDHSDEMTESDLAKLTIHPNCIIYPPIAYITEEASAAKQEMFTKNIERFLEGKPVNTVTLS